MLSNQKEYFTKKEFKTIIKNSYKTNLLYKTTKEQIKVLNSLIKENIKQIIKYKDLCENTKFYNDYKLYIFYYKEQLELLLNRKQSLIKETPKYDNGFTNRIIEAIYFDTDRCYYNITSKKLKPKQIHSFIDEIIILEYRLKKYNINYYAKDIKSKNKSQKEILNTIDNSIKDVVKLSNIIGDSYLKMYLNTKISKRLKSDGNVFIASTTDLLSDTHNYLFNQLKILFKDLKDNRIDSDLKYLLNEYIFKIKYNKFNNFRNEKFFTKTYL